MSNDQLDQQVVELDNLSEQREIVTFMRRSTPLNTSQRTALEQYGHLILEYPVGDLRQQFEHPERPLTVEIGFGMGRSLVLMAKANPERNYVGIEVHVPGIAQCVYEAGMAGLTNLRLLDADAIQVLREMPDNSINAVQLYFPDPWQKKRHFKRRFVSIAFLILHIQDIIFLIFRSISHSGPYLAHIFVNVSRQIGIGRFKISFSIPLRSSSSRTVSGFFSFFIILTT